MKKLKIAGSYFLICVLAIFLAYGVYALLASFAMLDLVYLSITEWAWQFRFIFGVISLWIIYCASYCAYKEFEATE